MRLVCSPAQGVRAAPERDAGLAGVQFENGAELLFPWLEEQ
jgi:hypothetical protein